MGAPYVKIACLKAVEFVQKLNKMLYVLTHCNTISQKKKLRKFVPISYIGPSPRSAETQCLDFYSEAGDSTFLRTLVPPYAVSKTTHQVSKCS